MEMILIILVALVGNRVPGAEVPVSRCLQSAISNLYIAGRWDSADPSERGQVRGREMREPACDVVFVQLKGTSGQDDERVKNGTPGHIIRAQIIIKMASADEILGQEQRLLDRSPDGQRPIPDQLCEAMGAPSCPGSRNNRKVGDVLGNGRFKLFHNFLAVVQNAVPRNDVTRVTQVWLNLPTRLLGCMKRKKPKADAARHIEMLAIRRVSRKETGYLIDIPRIHGAAIKIPPAKLGTHETAPP